MNHLAMVFLIVVGAVLQAIAPTIDWLGQARMPMLLGLVVYYSLVRDRRDYLFAAVLAGVLQDALSMIPLGYSSFWFCVVGLVINRFRELVFIREGITHILVGALANGGMVLGLFFMLSLDDRVSLSAGWVVLKVTGSILLGAVIVPLVFLAGSSLDRLLGIEGVRTA